MERSSYRREAAAVTGCPHVQRPEGLSPSAGRVSHTCGSSRRCGVARTTATFRPTTVAIPPIDRPTDPSPRAVKGAQVKVPSPAWSPGRRGQTPLAAAPIFSRRDEASISRSGPSGQLRPALLYIAYRQCGATQLSPRCSVCNGISVTTSDGSCRKTWRWPIFDRCAHHPPTPAPATSRNAQESSNHSSMAAIA